MTERAEERKRQVEEVVSSFYEKVRGAGLSKSLLEEKGVWDKVYTTLWNARNNLELLREKNDIGKARKTIAHIENDINTLLESCGKPGVFNKETRNRSRLKKL